MVLHISCTELCRFRFICGVYFFYFLFFYSFQLADFLLDSMSHKREGSGERKGEENLEQEPSFKCEETISCGISMCFFIPSACILLPVTPVATITCHPSRLPPLHCPLSPTLFPQPSLLVTCHPHHSLLLLPFCRAFPPIQLHTSQISARPYTPLPSLRGVAEVTDGIDDRPQHLLILLENTQIQQAAH